MSRVGSAPFRTSCHPSYSNWLSNRLYETCSSNDIRNMMNNQSYCLNGRAFYNCSSATSSMESKQKLGAIIGKQMQIFNLTQSSEMQKREQISAKLTNNNPGQNLNSLHINHLNLDSHANGSVRLNVRNKSANFEYAHTGLHPNATFYQINNSSLNNNMLNTQGLKPQNSLAKNFIDFNLPQQQQIQQTQLLSPGLQFTNNPTNRVASSRINSSNIKLINESNKFLEDILAHSKRSLKQTGALPNQNPPHSNRDQINHQGQTQLISSTSSVASSIQLPASNLIVINRTNEEKALFPDKLILERRNLAGCPTIESEDGLKLINYQHNQIKLISNLEQMRSLIFLDLYDNRIERIGGLSTLTNLRVLMLGKNRIQKVDNLNGLIYLDILDLHGNQISKVENLNHLHELRVLNLAANQIKVVENLKGLDSLVELNLRRNQIDDINELEYCTKLQRLFLSYNEIHSLTCIKNFSSIVNLQEFAMDNNPLCSEKNYKRNIIGQLLSLKKFDAKRITDEEKRVAEKLFLKDEYKRREIENLAFLEEKRKMTIKDAEIEWLSQQRNKKSEEIGLGETNGHSEEITLGDNIEGYDQKHTNGIDSGFSSSTNKSENSDYIERPFNEKSNSNGDLNRKNNASESYQTYLHQFQTQSLNGSNNKINAKLKIATMRNNNNNNVFSQSKSLSNVISNINSNSLSSSSSSSIISSHEKENEFKDPKTQSNEDYNYVQPNNMQRDTLSQVNSRSNSATGFQRTNQLKQTSPNTSSSVTQKPTNPTTTNSSQNINNPPTNSAQQIDANAAIKKSVALNGGSNVHEDNIMFFYGIKSLDILDIKLEASVISQVFTISFHYIDYDEHLSKNFAKIRNKFTNVNSIIFTCCNIRVLNQLDSLNEWKKLDSLTINKDDNPIYLISIWRQYALNRLSNLQMKRINNQMITLDDLNSSNKLFSTISNWALDLPEYKLLAILGQDKKRVIKLAKETNKPPTAEQIVARDTVIKSVLALNQNQFIKNSQLLRLPNTINNIPSIDENKISSTKCSKSLLNEIFSQMNYNDMKKQKIKQAKNQIWSSFIDGCIQSSADPQTHVTNLCKQHKIIL